MPDGHYNIVLVPNAEIDKAAVDLSHAIFSGISDGYCLEEGKVFPHITLGQFYTEDQDLVRRVAQQVEGLGHKTAPDITFSDAYAKPDTRDSIKYLWIGLAVLPSEELSLLQRNVHLLLQQEGISLLNGSLESYWPHLTLARIREETPIPPFVSPDCFKVDVIGGWKLAIGHSDRKGQFLGAL